MRQKKSYLNSFDREQFVHFLTLADIFSHLNKTYLIVQGLLDTIIDAAKKTMNSFGQVVILKEL